MPFDEKLLQCCAIVPFNVRWKRSMQFWREKFESRLWRILISERTSICRRSFLIRLRWAWCLYCRRCEQNWRQVKTVDDRKFRNCFVQSRNALRTTVLTCRQFCSHHWQDKTVFSCRWCELGLTHVNWTLMQLCVFSPPDLSYFRFTSTTLSLWNTNDGRSLSPTPARYERFVPYSLLISTAIRTISCLFGVDLIFCIVFSWSIHCRVWILSQYVVCLWCECTVTKRLKLGSCSFDWK